MMPMNTLFSEEEQTVRKWWLRIFLFQTAFADFSMFYKFPYGAPAVQYSPFAKAFFLAVFVITQLGVGYAIYHCAYKKQGTKVLTAVLVSTCLGFVFFGLQTIGTFISITTGKTVLLSLFGNDHSITDRLLTILSWIISFVYFSFVLRMRRINRARKEAKTVTATENIA
jgi:hypothetical protein